LGGETASSSRAAAALRPETSRPELPAQTEFCRLAEDLGLAGVLVDIGAAKPDPIVLSTALGLATRNLEFLNACRSGLQSPAVFVQQINTISSLMTGVSVSMSWPGTRRSNNATRAISSITTNDTSARRNSSPFATPLAKG
jgi:Luciferase-like monooxygenase